MIVTSKVSQEKSQVDPEDLFQRLEHIGRGSFGEVYKGINRKLSNIIAIKIIDLEKSEDEIEDIQQEIQVLSQCNSPYVTKYFGSYLKETKLWIVMEYLGGGSALDLMKPGVFNEKYIAIILREVLKGLEYLHWEKKIHRDIKAANILLSEHGDVKLADFGVAKQLTESINKGCTFVGTPFWMPPEVIMQHKYDYSADIWSLGITSIELGKGEPPNSDLHPMRVLLQIPKNPPPQLHGNDYSDAFREFVEACLQKNPQHRPTATQLRRFKFVSTTKSTKYLIELIIRYQNWKKKHDHEDKSDSGSNSDEDQSKHDSSQWEYGGGTVKSSINYDHLPKQSIEVNPLFQSIFDDLSIRYNIRSSNNNLRDNTENGLELFENLRDLFLNNDRHYPNLCNDFTRIMSEHISKGNSIRQTSTTDTNHVQISSGVVRMSI